MSFSFSYKHYEYSGVLTTVITWHYRRIKNTLLGCSWCLIMHFKHGLSSKVYLHVIPIHWHLVELTRNRSVSKRILYFKQAVDIMNKVGTHLHLDHFYSCGEQVL